MQVLTYRKGPQCSSCLLNHWVRESRLHGRAHMRLGNTFMRRTQTQQLLSEIFPFPRFNRTVYFGLAYGGCDGCFIVVLHTIVEFERILGKRYYNLNRPLTLWASFLWFKVLKLVEEEIIPRCHHVGRYIDGSSSSPSKSMFTRSQYM